MSVAPQLVADTVLQIVTTVDTLFVRDTLFAHAIQVQRAGRDWFDWLQLVALFILSPVIAFRSAKVGAVEGGRMAKEAAREQHALSAEHDRTMRREDQEAEAERIKKAAEERKDYLINLALLRTLRVEDLITGLEARKDNKTAFGASLHELRVIAEQHIAHPLDLVGVGVIDLQVKIDEVMAGIVSAIATIESERDTAYLIAQMNASSRSSGISVSNIVASLTDGAARQKAMEAMNVVLPLVQDIITRIEEDRVE